MVITWRRQQFASKMQCIVLSIFMTKEEVLVNGADSAHVQSLLNICMLQYP